MGANAEWTGTEQPNSANQRWSRWVLGIRADVKRPSVKECAENAQRFFAKGFGRAGRVRCDQKGSYYSFVVEVEGPPAHDPEFVRNVRQQFRANFVEKGFGSGARLVTFEVGILAGSREDGSPPEQLLVLPHIDLKEQLGLDHWPPSPGV